MNNSEHDRASLPGQRLGVVQLRLLLGCASACVVMLAVVGCQEAPATVEGQVTLDGKPLVIDEGMRGSVVFQPTSDTGAMLTGLIDSNGFYELSAGGNRIVPPSVYLVSVSATELIPSTGEGPASGRLVTPAKYANAKDSGFRIKVIPGPNEVNLQLLTETEARTSVEDGPVSLSTEGVSDPGAAPQEAAAEAAATPDPNSSESASSDASTSNTTPANNESAE